MGRMSQKDMLLVAVTCVITTMAELQDRKIPESVIYLSLLKLDGFSLDDWMRVKGILREMDVVKEHPMSMLSITTKGRELAAELNDAIKKPDDAV